MRPETWERLSRQHLTLDETAVPLEFDRDEVERLYLPLAGRILDLHSPARRTMAAVAWPPGSGKTAFARLLAAVINASAAEELAIAIGLDGWHYPNAYLDRHTIVREGKTIPLRSIKGAPETFDAETAYHCLESTRQGALVRCPVYSRVLHDPLPDQILVGPECHIVIVEGNYLLLDEEPWRKFHALFDLRIFLTARQEIMLGNLRQRHSRGGKSLAEIEDQLARVDLPNTERVLGNSITPHIRIEMAGKH
jgi:pantothenate kinase